MQRRHAGACPAWHSRKNCCPEFVKAPSDANPRTNSAANRDPHRGMHHASLHAGHARQWAVGQRVPVQGTRRITQIISQA
jgi:hypothetical protein